MPKHPELLERNASQEDRRGGGGFNSEFDDDAARFGESGVAGLEPTAMENDEIALAMMLR